MEQSPACKDNRSSVNKFPAFYETQKFFTAIKRACHCPCTEPDQSSPCPPSHSMKIHFNTIPLPSMDRSSKRSLSFMPPHQNPVCTSPLPHTYYMLCPPRHSLYDHSNNIQWIVQIIELIMESFLLPCSLVPLRPRYLPRNLILKHPKPMLSLNVTDQVSYPYEPTGKIIVLCIFIFIFLGSKLADNWFCTGVMRKISKSLTWNRSGRMTHSLFNKILLRLTNHVGWFKYIQHFHHQILKMEKESVSETCSVSKPPDADVTPRRLLVNSVAMKASRQTKRYQFCH